MEGEDLLTVTDYTGSASDPAFRSGPFYTCNGPFTQPDAFLPRNRRQNANNGIFKQPAAIEVLLREAAITHAVGCQSLEVLERIQYALSTEPVQSPEQDDIKLPARGGSEHLLKLLPLSSLARDMVNVLTDDCPALR